ncbi:Hypothetical protein NCS54_00619100 [Fusarium falciforme]|uniref:Hypothetical protein n=1 Tax=Fusarium falciforme TaxID=195108 RepID=UPI002301E1EC|nr:Hypothetical protein NCS54_00619100 [Fusarium falciforme]WAO88829.1 Hypothetical protein NCS54_00619100 [Fusarium falciforme]
MCKSTQDIASFIPVAPSLTPFYNAYTSSIPTESHIQVSRLIPIASPIMETLLNSAGDLPSAISQYKHFPITPDAPSKSRGYSSRNHFIRASAKRQAQSTSTTVCRDTGFHCTTATCGTEHCHRCGEDQINRGARRPQLERVLRNELVFTGPEQLRLDYRVRHPRNRGIPRGRTQTACCSDEAEGRDLARSKVPLPSDRYRLVRKPTLEREEAFRDASTAKGNVRLRRTQPVNDDAEIAELYRIGLLYDEEKQPEEVFDLNSIQHEEPVYTIRPAKRSRKNKKSHSFSFNDPLHLDLSFTDLGGDDSIAQFLSPTPSDDGSIPQGNGPSTHSFAPLRVIYELDGSQPSFDVDTSQPPDLVSDPLSDYDCFSDSELDDLPSEREVRDSAATPSSDVWVVLGDDS